MKYIKSMRYSVGVRGQVPRKQGLKLEQIILNHFFGKGPRASSTKTRIETSTGELVFYRRFPSEGKFHENKD